MTSLYAPTSDDVKQRLRPFGIFFEKSLKDLIKGIRSNNETPEKLQQFLSQALSECREEANSPDFNLKTTAVLKLIYLEMYGFDMSWANFHILEVMSSNKLQQKRVGYLAASQSFYKDSDILMLATNLMKKDLKYSGNNDVVKVGIALSGLSTIVTPSLAADICDDLFSMLSSSKPYIRKKAITALFKVFLQYPEALRDNFDKFSAKLEDEDTSVVSATVSVICELSKKNPQPFIQLSPLLYEILVTISNNWIIIRLLKLFTNLSKVEPKLRPRLLPKILELMDSTVATSVLYESINCIVKGNMMDEDDFDTAMRCLDRLHTFCDSSDPNLRYISCVLFYKIGKINTTYISQFDQLVLRLLNDVDVSIRSKAVELIEGIVDEDNLKNIVLVLLKQFVDEDVVLLQTGNTAYEAAKEIPIVIPELYKIKMVNTIIHICSMNNYFNLNDFEWYNTVLWDLAVLSQDLADKSLGFKIGEQLRNIMVKVPSMRDKTIAIIIKLLSNDDIYLQLPGALKDCLWSLGEYSSFIDNGDDLIRMIIEKKNFYSPEIQQAMIPALLKIFSNWCNGHSNIDLKHVQEVLQELLAYLEILSHSKAFEVQERAVESAELLKLNLEAMEEENDELPLLMSEVLPSFFNSYELKPIAHGTQQKVQQNITLDCETPFLTEEELWGILDQEDYHDSDIHSDGSLSIDRAEYDNEQELSASLDDIKQHDGTYLTNEEQEEVDKRRREELESNPFYLAREDDAKESRNGDLLDLTEESPNEQGSNIIRLNKKEFQLETVSNEHVKDKTKKKKHKRRVQVLPDEIVVGNNSANVQNLKATSSAQSISTLGSSSKGKINLKPHSKLESFDFSKPAESRESISSEPLHNYNDEEQKELEILRAKLEEQGLTEAKAGDDVEEVVIIKKKKKKSTKKKSIRQPEEKSKNNVQE